MRHPSPAALHCALGLAWLFTLAVWAQAAAGDSKVSQQSTDSPAAPSLGGSPAAIGITPGQYPLAFFPLANHSGSLKAVRIATPMIRKELAQKGLPCLPNEKLRIAVRQLRIRADGSISHLEARAVSGITGVEFIAIGSINIFHEGEIPEFGISIRILHVPTNRLVWSASEGATGQDRFRPFGLDGGDSVEDLGRRVIRRMFNALTIQLIHEKIRAASGDAWVAIIPFENLSDNAHAHSIVQDLLLNRLFQGGHWVVEPGGVRELLQARRFTYRGEVDAATARSLRQKLRSRVLITGSVDRFAPGSGSAANADPAASLSLKLLDARTNRILAMVDGRRKGSDGEWVFRIGKEYSLQAVTDRLLEDLLGMNTVRDRL